MIQPNLLTRLRLLAEGYRLPVAAADRPREVTPASAPRRILAEVEAKLPDGRYRVSAAGQRFEIDLPAGAQPGQRVQIALPQATDTGGSAPRSGPGGDVLARVSDAGRLVAQLLQQDTGSKRLPTSIDAAQRLLPDAPVDVAKTAATLRELIGLSGLFYESHQAEWVDGMRDTAQLLREPQGRRSPLPAGMAAAPSAAGDASSPMRQAGIDPGTAPIVRQQLTALETSHIVWAGQIWPGQQMRWEIEAADREPLRPIDAQRRWQTRIDLALPRMGSVTAILSLDPSGLRVRLSARVPDTGAMISGRLADLRSALAAAGLPLISVIRVPHADA